MDQRRDYRVTFVYPSVFQGAPGTNVLSAIFRNTTLRKLDLTFNELRGKNGMISVGDPDSTEGVTMIPLASVIDVKIHAIQEGAER